MSESDLVRSIRETLTLYETMGNIVWFERLNSGKVLKEAGKTRYMVYLCRTGTPDFIVVTRRLHPTRTCRHTVVDFLECKTEKGKLTPEQKEFEHKVCFPEVWANFYIIRDLEEVIKLYASD